MTRQVAVVVHDVAPATWTACRRLLDDVRDIADVAVTLLAVPRYHGAAATAAFERDIGDAASRGDDIALHGFTHRDDGVPSGWLDRARRRWYTAGEGEFAALPREEAARRIDAGAAWFRANGWPLAGFVAPAWLMSEGTRAALADFPIDYTCTLTTLVALPRREVLQSRAVVYSTRAAWRRAASVLWCGGVARAIRSPLLRIELHPPDSAHPAVRRSWMAILRRALAEGAEPVTLARAAARIPTASNPA